MKKKIERRTVEEGNLPSEPPVRKIYKNSLYGRFGGDIVGHSPADLELANLMRDNNGGHRISDEELAKIIQTGPVGPDEKFGPVDSYGSIADRELARLVQVDPVDNFDDYVDDLVKRLVDDGAR